MARKAKDTPHLRVRVEPSLLTRLEKAAEKNERTLNGEIVRRLQQSFETDDRIEIYRATMTERIAELIKERDAIKAEKDEIEAGLARVQDKMKRQASNVQAIEQAQEKLNLLFDVLFGENKLKTELLRSVALELADAPDDWLNDMSGRRQIAERVASRFEKLTSGRH